MVLGHCCWSVACIVVLADISLLLPEVRRIGVRTVALLVVPCRVIVLVYVRGIVAVVIAKEARCGGVK